MKSEVVVVELMIEDRVAFGADGSDVSADSKIP